MAGMSYQKIVLKDLSRGIDARSSEDSIEPGFAEDLLNCTTNSSGFIAKRKGYQGYYGYVPLRVKEASQNGTDITFCLDETINLLSIESTPIVVYGKLGAEVFSTVSGTSTDWDNTSGSNFIDGSHYYLSFVVQARKTLTADNTDRTIILEHTLATDDLLVGVTESTSTSTLSNDAFFPDSMSISQSGSNDVTYGYNLGGSDKEAFLYVANKTSSTGSIYTATFVTGDFTANVLTITAATHGLTDINIIPQLFEDIGPGTSYDVVEPDDFTVKANGDVEITVSSTFDGKIVLSDVAASNTAEAGVIGGSSVDITVTPASGSIHFHAVYLRLANGDRELIIPEAISFDSTTENITYTLIPPASFSGNIQVMFEEATVLANCITVTDTTSNSVTFDTDNPQLTLWGISHEGIYPNTDAFGGNVTHIDSYRRELEARLVSNVGGIFHAARTRAESGTSYLIPSTTISLNARASTSTTIGPVFVQTAVSTNIARAVKADNIVSGLVEVTAATYTGTPDQVTFTLNFTNKSGTLAGITSADQLTVSSMAFRFLNGTHQIISVDNAANTITVTIAGINSDDFDETGACGRAGVFTDTLILASTSPFLVDDELLSNLFDGAATPIVIDSSGSTIVMSGITSEIDIPGGLLLRGKRTSTVVPLLSVTNFVKGDMCTLTGFEREFRVTSIDTSASTIIIDETLTFEEQESSTSIFAATGRWIPIEAPISSEGRVKRTYQQYLDANNYENQGIVRSTMVNDNMYFTNGSDEVFKFDGTNNYRAGLQRWQPHLFISLDNTVPAIAMPDAVAAVSAVGGTEFTVDSNASLSKDDQIVHDDDNAVYTVTSVYSSGGSQFVKVNIAITGAAAGDLRPLRKLQYYFRLNAIDANQNIVASATTGANDFITNLTDDAQIQLKLVGFPTFDAYDYDRIELKIFRADADIAEFFQIGVVDLNFDDFEGYIVFTDNSDGDEALNISDETTIILEGTELGNTWAQPLRGKYITTTSNKLVLANIKDYPEISLTLRQTTGANITTSNLNAEKFTLRKSGTSTATDMITVANYEWVDSSGAVTIAPAADISNAAATSFTITSASHGLAIKDWVYLYHAVAGVNNDLTFAGWHQIATVPTINTFTINSNTGTIVSTASDIDRYITASTTADIPILVGTDGNYNNNSGNSSLSYERLGMIRLANAINATMTITDTTLSGQTTFIPWVVAAAGDEIGLGNITFRAPQADIVGLNVVLPSSITNGEFIANLETTDFSATVVASERQFPSRIITSFRNFGEIFDGPFGLDDDSSNVFDISPADGQEITAIITFFARAPFGSAQVEDMLVVFKENSIHVVNIASGEVKRLETQGVGCSVPFSVAYSRNGIIFAHESGIYRLNKDLNISYVGKHTERFWQDNIVKNDLSRATGTHFNIGRQYKLSIPFGSSQRDNNQVLTYDHTRETDERVEYGAWSRHNNHPATGWANLENDSYFGATTGNVFKLRNVGDETDYRDDASAIGQEIIYAPLDFGLPGVLKVVNSLVLHFQLRDSDLTGSTVSAAVNLSNIFQDLDAFSLEQDTNDGGLDQLINPTVQSVKFKLPSRRGEFFSIKLVNTTLDEDMILSGIIFSVAASSSATILEAKSST